MWGCQLAGWGQSREQEERHATSLVTRDTQVSLAAAWRRKLSTKQQAHTGPAAGLQEGSQLGLAGDRSALSAAGTLCQELSGVAVPRGSHSQGKRFEGRDPILS